jgi:F-type H+-transporting ATPase subunit delta
VSREELPTNYAQAIYKMALEEWTSWLTSVQQQLLADKAASEALFDAGGSPGEKRQRLDAILPAESSIRFKQFLGFLLEKGNLRDLDEIIGSFEGLVERGAERAVAHVTSALELSDEERTQVEDSLRRRFGAGLDFEFQVDQALLGGVRVRVGDTVIDSTVATKLESLRDHLGTR